MIDRINTTKCCGLAAERFGEEKIAGDRYEMGVRSLYFVVATESAIARLTQP